MSETNKIDQILSIVASESLTRAELIKRIGTTANSLASLFTSLRLAAKFSPEKLICPDVDADGKVVLVAYSDYEARQQAAAAGRTAKAPKTPREAYAAAEKNLARAKKVLEGSTDDGTELGTLCHQRAEINVKIATLELAAAEKAWKEADKAAGEAVDPIDPEDGVEATEGDDDDNEME